MRQKLALITVIAIGSVFGFIRTALGVYYPLMEDTVLPITIGKTGYTRLSIEEERVKDVFVYPQEAMQIKIHSSGYVIIAADFEWPGWQGSENNQAVYMTITGEEGTTQDLSLRLAGEGPKPVKLVKYKLGEDLTIKGE